MRMTMPTGRKVETSDAPASHVGSVAVLPQATAERLELSRRHFSEARIEDFERRGKSWIDRASAAQYRIAPDPLLASDPKATTVAAFIVLGDRVLYLKKRGDNGRTETTHIGSVGGSEVAGPPPLRTGPVIY